MTLKHSKYKYKVCFSRAVYDSQKKAKQFIIKGVKYSTTIYSLHYLESKFESYPLNSTSQVRRLLPNKPIQRFVYHHGVNTKKGDIPYLKEVLKKTLCKRLISLDFLLTDSCLIKDKDLKFICSALKQCISLKYLNLTLQNLYSVTGSGFANLKSTFGRLISLNDLKLQFAVCHKVDEIGKEYLLKSFKGFHGHKLQSIYLNIGRIYSDLSEFLPRFIKIISNIQNLKSLGLNLLSNDIEADNFIESCDNLSQITCLQIFTLTTMRGLSPKEIEALVNACSKLKELRSVNLKLKQFEYEQYHSLSRSLAQLDQLEELKLSFFQENPTYQSLEASKLLKESELGWKNQGLLMMLGPFLESHTKILKTLDLQFFLSPNLDSLSIEHISSEGLIKFSKHLSLCTQLQNLHLFLPFRFDAKSLSFLLKSISGLDNLKILFLFIAADTKADLQTIPNLLSEALAHNTKLEKLSLFLRNFNNFGNEGIQEFSKTLPKLTHLRKVTFEIYDCEPIKRSAITKLTGVLKTAPRIKKAELGFIGPGKQRNLSIKELCYSDKWKSVNVYESAIPYALSKACSFDLL